MFFNVSFLNRYVACFSENLILHSLLQINNNILNFYESKKWNVRFLSAFKDLNHFIDMVFYVDMVLYANTTHFNFMTRKRAKMICFRFQIKFRHMCFSNKKAINLTQCRRNNQASNTSQARVMTQQSAQVREITRKSNTRKCERSKEPHQQVAWMSFVIGHGIIVRTNKVKCRVINHKV